MAPLTLPYMPKSATEPARKQVSASPPRDGYDLRVLQPGKEQKHTKYCFHVDGDEKKRVDVEIHRANVSKE
jgi:hypothetical protein